LSLISMLEEFEAGSSLTAFHRCMNMYRKLNHQKNTNKFEYFNHI
jgi:hypothetical protein